MDTTQLSDCLYLADPAKLYFIPYCDGDLTGRCSTCQKTACKGWWGGDNREDDEDEGDRQIAPKRQTRENRVLELELAYRELGQTSEEGLVFAEDTPSPLDYLSCPDFLVDTTPYEKPSAWERGYNAATQGVVKGRGRPKLNPDAAPADLDEVAGNEWRGGYCEGLRCLARFPNSHR